MLLGAPRAPAQAMPRVKRTCLSMAPRDSSRGSPTAHPTLKTLNPKILGRWGCPCC